ncbi:hypothetical protein [Flaviaesturariibacter amylovorans]|uniref:DUF4369 domain-containing protein n=1 Tax=Flaviaesturariibacter amylovorans TaxID=1084520 RepID=A0ABP8GVI6_9BACT
MKKLLFLLLSAPLFSSAQDSCSLKSDRDPYTKEVRLSTGLIRLGDHKFSAEANAKEIDLFFALGGDALCFNDQSSAVVNFSGTRLRNTYRSGGTMNCEGFFHIIFRNTPETSYSFRRLFEQRIGVISITNGKQTVEIKLTEEQKDLMQRALSCLARDAKGLIPAAQ